MSALSLRWLGAFALLLCAAQVPATFAAIAPRVACAPIAPLIAPAPAAPRVASRTVLEDQRVDLAGGSYTRNGVASDGATRGVPGTPDADTVRLPFSQRGVRWAVQFSTTEAFTARLMLDWNPGPDGLLFEIVLDGQRLSPVRDGWRPSPRALSSDLGPAWLGAGSHLLEFVAREQSPDAALHLRSLLLERL